MQLSEITFKKLYQQIVYNLKKRYNRAGSVFTLGSPFGQLLSTTTELFQLNMLHVQNVQRSMDMNDVLNDNDKTIRALAKIGQYNPSRGQAASGSIELKLKAGTVIEEELPGSKVIFTNRQKLKNVKNNLEYILDLNQDDLTFTLNNQIPISLNIIQGSWITSSFTGTGELNQSYTINSPNGKQIDNYKFNLYVNSELWTPRKHKFDMLSDEKAYVPYTGFSGGVDIIFGNGSEGMIPELGSIIVFEFLATNGIEGNLIDPQLNEFKFVDMPRSSFNVEIDTGQFFDIYIETDITFGSVGDTNNYLKSIMPYVSSNFVLVGPDQYKFFLQRLGLFSIIDVYTSKKQGTNIINDIYTLAKKNTDLLYTINDSDNSSTLSQLVAQNLNEIKILRKLLLTEGGDNLINVFIIPDIRIYYGKTVDINYFNIDTDLFTLNNDEKKRILNYLSNEGLQVITNEVKIVDILIKKYVLNITLRIYDDAVQTNIINEITSSISDYFISEMRRDRIPPSDIVRIIDSIYGVDSVVVEYISEENENYHKEFLIKSQEFYIQNGRVPEGTELIMGDGKSYDNQNTVGLDPILGDILIEKTELPLIRGGFTDRYNNYYNLQPGMGQFSPINILILPEKTKRKQLK
jgi:hypothetical protein